MPVCITGMHRSGTSLVARLLNLCGVYLGDERKMIAPNPDNPKGFWEYRPFAELNDKILKQLDASWNYPPLVMPTGWYDSPEFSLLKAEAKQLITTFAPYDLWGWKDPRTSLTLPFWQGLLPDLKVVICLRSPLEVAQSLKKREAGGIEPRDLVHYPYRLWQIYYDRLLAACPAEKRILTHYESYFCDAPRELQRLAEFLEIDIPAANIQAAVDFVSTQLYRQQSAVSDLITSQMPLEALETYLDLCQLAGPVYKQTESHQTWQEILPADPKQRRLALLETRAVYPKTILNEDSSSPFLQVFWANSGSGFEEALSVKHAINLFRKQAQTFLVELPSGDLPTLIRIDPVNNRRLAPLVILQNLRLICQNDDTQFEAAIKPRDADQTAGPNPIQYVNIELSDEFPGMLWVTNDDPQIIVDLSQVMPPDLSRVKQAGCFVSFDVDFISDWRKQEGVDPLQLLEMLRHSEKTLDEQKITIAKQIAATNELQTAAVEKSRIIFGLQRDLLFQKRKVARLEKIDIANKFWLEKYSQQETKVFVPPTPQPPPPLEATKTKVLMKTVGERVATRAGKELRQRLTRQVSQPSPSISLPPQPVSTWGLIYKAADGIPWPAPHISILLLEDEQFSTVSEQAVEAWLARQTYASAEIIVWDRANAQAYDLANPSQAWSAATIKALAETLLGRYVCCASPDLISQPVTYLESNLIALESESLAFTVNLKGQQDEATLQHLDQGKLPGNIAMPLLRQLVRAECLSNDLTLDLQPWLAGQKHGPVVAGKVIFHTSNLVEPESELWHEVDLGKIATTLFGQHILALSEVELSQEAVHHVIHPVDTVLPPEPVVSELPTVLVVFPFLAVGGAERVALDMINYLKDRIRFVVVTVEPYDMKLGTCVDAFREITPFVYTAPDYLSSPLNFSFFVHLIQRFQPHTLYIANGTAWVYDALAQLKVNYPHLRIANQVYDYELGWISRYDPLLASTIDAHIGSNQKICEAFSKRGVTQSKIYHIVNGVDEAMSDPENYTEESIAELKNKFGLPHDKKIVSFLARLHPQKRPMDFVELARQFSTDPSLTFFLVGDGPLATVVDDEIKKIGLKNVVRHSFYQPAEDLYAVSDVLVLPSEYEGMPMVVMHMQAMGKPVVVTDVGNNREFLEKTGGGIVVSEIGNVGGLRAGLQQVLNQPPDPTQLRQTMLTHFGVPRMAEKYCQALLGN